MKTLFQKPRAQNLLQFLLKNLDSEKITFVKISNPLQDRTAGSIKYRDQFIIYLYDQYFMSEGLKIGTFPRTTRIITHELFHYYAYIAADGSTASHSHPFWDSLREAMQWTSPKQLHPSIPKDLYKQALTKRN